MIQQSPPGLSSRQSRALVKSLKASSSVLGSRPFCERPVVWNVIATTFEYSPVAMVRIVQ